MKPKEIILELEKLSQEERREVFRHFVQETETFQLIDGSTVSEDWILEEVSLCKTHVNTEEHTSADDFCESHGLT
jgi:hypothetical protein